MVIKTKGLLDFTVVSDFQKAPQSVDRQVLKDVALTTKKRQQGCRALDSQFFLTQIVAAGQIPSRTIGVTPEAILSYPQ
jgi:hypothetical protein